MRRGEGRNRSNLGVLLIVGQAFLPAGKRERLPYKIRDARCHVLTLGPTGNAIVNRKPLQPFDILPLHRFNHPQKAYSLLPMFLYFRYRATSRNGTQA